MSEGSTVLYKHSWLTSPSSFPGFSASAPTPEAGRLRLALLQLRSDGDQAVRRRPSLSSMLRHLLPPRPPGVRPQRLQSLPAQVLGAERLPRMSRLPRRLHPREASHQPGPKDRGRDLSGPENKPGPGRLPFSQREAEDLLPERREAHLSGVPNLQTAQGSRVLPCGGGLSAEKGRGGNLLSLDHL